MAIVDPVLAADLPPTITADSGFDALTHATESYVSVYANDFTDGLALQAIKLIFGHLEHAVHHGAADPEAREQMHNAGTIAGMAFGSAFLGIVHAMSHTLGATFHIAHGRTNAILLPHVIRYNGTVPGKLTGWPKYDSYRAQDGRRRRTGVPRGLAATAPDRLAKYPPSARSRCSASWPRPMMAVVAGGGVLLGIVSRRDTLRAMVRSDDMLTAEAQHRLDAYADGQRRWTAAVEGGVARITGDFDDDTEPAVVVVLARTVPGVATVDLVPTRGVGCHGYTSRSFRSMVARWGTTTTGRGEWCSMAIATLPSRISRSTGRPREPTTTAAARCSPATRVRASATARPVAGRPASVVTNS